MYCILIFYSFIYGSGLLENQTDDVVRCSGCSFLCNKGVAIPNFVAVAFGSLLTIVLFLIIFLFFSRKRVKELRNIIESISKPKLLSTDQLLVNSKIISKNKSCDKAENHIESESSKIKFEENKDIESNTLKISSHFDTLVIHGGEVTDKVTGAVNIPIYQTSTFQQKQFNAQPKWEYSRSGNPTRYALETLIAELENGTQGFAFASGMAAISAVLTLFKSGDKILCGLDVYGGTFRILDKIYKKFGVEFEQINTCDLLTVESAFNNNNNNNNNKVKAIILESPTNPLLTVTDIKSLSSLAQRHNILTIVDNTFLTPYYQKPLDLGADIVIHSATKYLGGHSDIIAGLVVVKNEVIAKQLSFIQNAVGAVLQPFDSFLLVRSIKTLPLRMERHVYNAKKIVEFLTHHKNVGNLYFPNMGAIISFEVINIEIKQFLEKLKIIVLAESLGGVESLICHPATMTHASIPEKKREEIKITSKLVRLSVGVENVNDLIDDLDQALGCLKIL